MLKFQKRRSLERIHTHKQTYGKILSESADGIWFIGLGQSIDELRNNHAACVRMYHLDYKHCIVQMKITYLSDEKELFIGDIVSAVENQGFGSKALESAIQLARELECRVIRGNLGPSDVNHFDKLKYWYEKYGFTVEIDGNLGSIELKL